MKIIFLGAKNPETGRMIKALERKQPNFEVLGFIDNDKEKKGKLFLGYPVFGGFEILDKFLGNDVYFVNLITGSTKTRYETSKFLIEKGCKITNFIHPSVDLSMTRIGTGIYIQEGVILQPEVEIGNNTAINMGSLIAHESKIGHSVFMAPGCRVAGCVEVGDGTFIGTNATILPRLRIGKWVTIGAGTVVIHDVPDYATVVGNPARIIKLDENGYYSNGDIYNN